MHVKSMLTPAEEKFLREIAIKGGVALNVGAWLGGSARCFLDGGMKVFSYDRFIWQSYMYNAWPDSPYKPGESFLEEFKKNCPESIYFECSLEDHIPYAEDCSILFIDAFKSPPSAENGFRTFLPYVKEGGLIVDQDFGWKPTTYVYSYCTYFALRDYLALYKRVDWTAAFRVIKRIPPEVAEQASKYSDFKEKDHSKWIVDAVSFFRDKGWLC